MPITLDLIATGLVTSSLFLMAISIPRIIMVLVMSKIRFLFLSKIEQSDEVFERYPILLSWIPKSVIEAWRDPREVVNTINGELKKLVGLGKEFVEGATAAIFLTVAALYLGVEGGAALVIALLIIFLIGLVVVGGITVFRYVAKMTSLLNRLGADQATLKAALPEPKVPTG